jgi:phage recombination protein Bet
VDAVFPSAKTTEAVELALAYCRARNLDPFKRPVHIVPIWDSKRGAEVETVWPGIGELRTTAARTGQLAGCDEATFGPEMTRTFKGTTGKGQYAKDVEKTVTFPEWCQVVLYRLVGGQRMPFPGPKVRWLETYATMGQTDVPNEMWATRPYGQIEKCAEAAALRRAFPEEVGSEMIHEEVGRREPAIDVTPQDVAPGAKTGALVEKLKARSASAESVAAPAAAELQSETDPAQHPVESEAEPLPGDVSGGEEGEPLTPTQAKEIRDLAKRLRVSISAIEEGYGCGLESIVVPGLSAKGLEAQLVKEIRTLAAAAGGQETIK